MSPPKKRIKTDANDSDESTTSSSSTSSPSYQELDDYFNNLLEKINSSSNNPSEDDLMASLLTLKAWQNDLLLDLEHSQAELDQAWVRRERQERALAALAFERDHLDNELETCRNFNLKYLKQLAREEMAPSEDSSSMDEDAVLAKFLGANVHDPSEKQKIIARLHQELNARGGLKRDLKLKQKELQGLQQELQTKQSFLQSLPDHLASLERASLPLQKFMTIKNPSSQNTILIGTERQQRIQLAQSLPAPLYTLFQQLQYFLDRPRLDESEEGNSHMSLSISTAETDPQVVLQIPVPPVAGNRTSTKRVSIHFHYSTEHNLVSAVASGCSSVLQQDVLLEELFPNDVPGDITGVTGRPYHWCNYLAGLHVVPQVQQQPVQQEGAESAVSSTRVIVQELQRRVRANATLKHILYSLQRCHVPKSTRKRSESTCKLVKFSASKSSGVTEENKQWKKMFSVQFQIKNSPVHTQVSIDLARYPGQPPVWNLNPITEEGTAKETPLYDARLSALERHVNVTGLEELAIPEKGDDDDDEISNKEENAVDESNYEEILLHQLRYVMDNLGE